MKIIGIRGDAGAGKNEVARLIQDNLDWCKSFAFASRVKLVYETIFGEDYEDSQEWKKEFAKGFDFTRRHALQGIGDGLRNSIHHDIWVGSLMHEIEEWQVFSDDRACVITDVRYLNEVNAILDRGGVVVCVVRPNNPTPSMIHISERGLDGLDSQVIINDGSIDDLKIKVQNFLKNLNL